MSNHEGDIKLYFHGPGVCVVFVIISPIFPFRLKILQHYFYQSTYLNHSGVAGATVGNIILGGGIGWAIDSAAGADNKYDTPVNITLIPKQHHNKTPKPDDE